MIPKDPFMLLSWLNTQLRDFYPSLEELCKAHDLEMDILVQTLNSIDYTYDPESNRFV